jgi:hypothetical protein
MTQELGTAKWRKSSFSGSDGSNCVEVAPLAGGRRAVRDSKYPSGPVMTFPPAEWVTFLDHLRSF